MPAPRPIYLDNAATTRPSGRVVEAMAEAQRTLYGNPSSKHAFGPPAKRALDDARGFIDDTFRKHLDEVTVTIESLPSEAILRESDPPMDPELLGLFVGVPLSEKTNFSPGGELPPRILVFQRNLERMSASRDELHEQIRVTLYHELGHYLGFEEEDMDDLGLA